MIKVPSAPIGPRHPLSKLAFDVGFRIFNGASEQLNCRSGLPTLAQRIRNPASYRVPKPKDWVAFASVLGALHHTGDDGVAIFLIPALALVTVALAPNFADCGGRWTQPSLHALAINAMAVADHSLGPVAMSTGSAEIIPRKASIARLYAPNNQQKRLASRLTGKMPVTHEKP